MIHCHANELSLKEWQDDSDARHKRGERQVYCLKCRLWIWPDHVAHAHKEHTRTIKEFDQIVKRAKARQE